MSNLAITSSRRVLGRVIILSCLALGFTAALPAKGNVDVGIALGVKLPRGAVSINVGKERYYQHRGVYYRKGPRGYHVVSAPRGAVVRQLPRSAVRIVVDSRTYYRYDNVYYTARSDGYEIVPTPRVSTVVVSEPSQPSNDGYESVWLNEQEYHFKNGQFFKPTAEGLVWVEAPLGATIRELPEDAVTVWHHDIEYFDVDNAIFRKTPDGYKVVSSPWN